MKTQSRFQIKCGKIPRKIGVKWKKESIKPIVSAKAQNASRVSPVMLKAVHTTAARAIAMPAISVLVLAMQNALQIPLAQPLSPASINYTHEAVNQYAVLCRAIFIARFYTANSITDESISLLSITLVWRISLSPIPARGAVISTDVSAESSASASISPVADSPLIDL